MNLLAPTQSSAKNKSSTATERAVGWSPDNVLAVKSQRKRSALPQSADNGFQIKLGKLAGPMRRM
jgi:hypothetical protein